MINASDQPAHLEDHNDVLHHKALHRSYPREHRASRKKKIGHPIHLRRKTKHTSMVCTADTGRRCRSMGVVGINTSPCLIYRLLSASGPTPGVVPSVIILRRCTGPGNLPAAIAFLDSHVS